MKAIILAAGRGSRMKDLTEDRPKCLVKIGENSLLDLQLIALREAGIEEIGIVTGYRRELLSDMGLVEFYNSRWEETNMVSSLFCASEWLEEASCVVSYSDIFYDVSAVKSLMNSSAKLAVTYDPNWRELWEKRFGDPLLDAETFLVSQDGALCEIGNKPETIEEVEGQYMGLLYFTPAGWCQVGHVRGSLTLKERDTMHMTGTLQKVIEAGHISIAAIPYLGKWGEVDSAEDLAVYQ